MCKRNTGDPLLRVFLDRYNLHLLAIPRENAAPGDLYVHDGKRASVAGSVVHFLQPPLEVPPVTRGEQMADILGKLSQAVSVTAGLQLLEAFFNVLGAVGLAGKVKAGLEAKKTANLRFRFTEATRDSVDVMQLGAALIPRKLLDNHPLQAEGHRYYLVTAVARSPSISVAAENDAGAAVNFGAEVQQLGNADANVDVKKTGAGEVTFSGKKRLVFGVELYELAHDKKRNRLTLANPKDPLLVHRAGAPQGAGVPLYAPAFIGGPDGEAFI